MWQTLGHFQNQPAGYKAFVPLPFPPPGPLVLPPELHLKHSEAMRWVGKLEGVAQLLPERDVFLLMFVRKEAAPSCQIEGTSSTWVTAVEADVVPKLLQSSDVTDILYHIRALNHGLARLNALPLSIRLIREVHNELLKEGRHTHNPFPGEIRYTQNWIGGSSPLTASFVPPPPHEIARALGDLEKFAHAKEDGISPLIKAAILHAQFETIHPFVDGNGRTGRLLITLFLWQQGFQSSLLLYFSEFFKRHQALYYQRLQGYRSDPVQLIEWIDFFLEAVLKTAESAYHTVCRIHQLHEQDMAKAQQVSKAAVASTVDVLRRLYRQPIVNLAKIQEWTGFTRRGAQKVIDRLIELEILAPRARATYGRLYEYRAYLAAFLDR